MNITKTQIRVLEKSILFELADKRIIQKKIKSYKCLKGFKVTHVDSNKVIFTRHLGRGTYGSVMWKNGSWITEVELEDII